MVFHYNRKTCLLEHSFGKLIDFNKPPHLINCKDPINEEGLKLGEFHVDSDSVVFCATDALAHYIIMCYEISKCNLYGEELTEAINAGTKILFVSIRRQPGQLILGIELLINYVNVLHTIISSKTM